MKTPLFLLLFTFISCLTSVSATVDITTRPAEQVTDLSATLSGTINVHSVGFWIVSYEFGKTAALELGEKASEPFYVMGAQAGENTLTINSKRLVLEPSTTYYFRFKAHNKDDSNEVYRSTIQSFTTLPAATAPTANLIDNWSPPPFSHKQGVLRANVFSGSSLTKIIFQYGTSANHFNNKISLADLQGVNTTTEVDCYIENLSPSTTYYYRCLVSNAQGSSYSDIKSFKTTAAPTLMTGNASNIKADSATLRGTVDLNDGLQALVYFQYGKTTDYGKTSMILSSTDGTHFETTISGLKPDTTYHYRLMTQQNSGVYGQAVEYGEDRTFHTKVAGENPQFDALPLVSERGIHEATVSLQNLFTGTSNTTFKIEYGKTDAYGEVVNFPTPLSGFTTHDHYDLHILHLDPDTTYHFRVIATNATGTVVSDPATFKTCKQPVVHTGAATIVKDIKATVTGSFTTFGGQITPYIQWGTSTQYGYHNGPLTAGNEVNGEVQLTAEISTKPNTLYHYRFYVYDGLHYHYGEDKTLTTTSASTLPSVDSPTIAYMPFSAWEMVWGTTRKFITANAACVRFSIEPGIGTASISVEYGKTESLGLSQDGGSTNSVIGRHYVTLLNLEPDTVYYWRARATNSAGTVYTDIKSFKTLKAPTVITKPAISVTDTSATLVGEFTPNRWLSDLEIVYGLDSSTPLTAQQITPEYVNGLTNPEGTFILNLTPRNVTASITGLTPNTTYYYRLKAKQEKTFPPHFYQGDVLSFTTAPPATPPSIHGELTLASRSENSAQLVLGGFNAGSSPSTVVLEYGITTAYGSQITHAETFAINAVASPQFHIQGLNPNTLYHARVTITNGQGSVHSLDFEFKTLPPGEKPSLTGVARSQNITTTSAQLFVDSLTTGNAETTLTYQYGLTNAYGESVTRTFSANNTYNNLLSTISGLSPNTLYHFKITASSGYGSVSTADAVFTTLPLPEVATSNVTGVTDLTATLHGVVQPHGTYGTVHFNWGETTDYGHTLLPLSPYTASTDPVSYSLPITGLKPNTTYHFRITFNDKVGDDLTFTTTAPNTPPTIEGNVLVFEQSSSGAKLRIDKINAGGSPATISFEYGTSTAYGQQVTLPNLLELGTSLNFPVVMLDGLTPNTLYHARCKVSNEHGTAYSSDITFSTGFKLSTQSATEVTDINAIFHGVVNAGGGVFNNISFDWWAESGDQHNIAASVSSATGMEDIAVTAQPVGLLPSTHYHYRLRATDAIGHLCYGPTLSFVTAEAASKPKVFDSVQITSVNTTTASIATSSVGVQAGGAVTTVSFEYGTTTSYGSSAVAGAPLQPGTREPRSINLTNLQPDTLYHIRIKASNSYGDDYSEDTTFRTLANPVVQTLPVINVSDLSVTFRGTLQLNGTSPYYSKTFYYALAGGNYNRQVNVPNPISTDPNTGELTFSSSVDHLTPNTQYKVQFRYKNSWMGDEITFTTAQANTPPTIGDDFTGLHVSDTRASFSTPLIYSGSSQTSITVEYGTTTSYGSQVSLDVLNLGTTLRRSVNLVNLTPNTLYHVRVKVQNGEGSSYSPDFSFTTYDTPSLVLNSVDSITDVSAIYKATVNPKGQNLKARFECRKTNNPNSNTSDSSIITISGNASAPLLYDAHHVLEANQEYSCKLVLFDSFSHYYTSNSITFTTSAPASPPEILAPLTVINKGSKSASFKINNSSGEDFFAGSSNATLIFEYGTSTNFGQELLYPLSPIFTAFHKSYLWPVSVTGLTPGQTYYVRAKATNAQGTSYSNVVSFNTLPTPSLTTQPATEVSEFSAVLNGSIDPLVSAANTYFKWGLTEDLTNTITASFMYQPLGGLAKTSVVLRNLLPNTTYYYQVYAKYSTDSNYYSGEVMSFTTSPATSLPTAPSAPSILSIRSTSVHFMAQWASGGATSDVVLEYGTSSSFGSIFNISSAHPPGLNNSFSSPELTGLQPATTYYMRLKVSSSLGTVYSPVTIFNTKPLSVPKTNAAYNITQNSVKLSGGVQAGASPTSKGFEWGDDTSYGHTIAYAYGSESEYSANLSGLLPARTYHYRFFVVDNGQTIYGDDVTFSTLSPNTPPTLSNELTAYGITASAATVWIRSVSAPANIIFEYGTTTALGSQKAYPISTVNSYEFRNVELELTDLSPNTTYYYRCVATNSQGSKESEIKSFKTLPAPLLSAKSPDDLLGASVTLKAEINPRKNLLKPVFEYGTTSGFTYTANSTQPLVRGTAAVDVGVNVSGLQPETTYHFRVTATDPRGKKYVGPVSTITTLSLIQGWRKKYFGTTDNTGNAADDAAPFGDGVSNLMKYALGIAPQNHLPKMVSIRKVQGKNRLSISFNRNDLKTDLTYTVEASDTLIGTWEVLATSSHGAPISGRGIIKEIQGTDGVIHVEVTDTVDFSSRRKRFIRLKVTRNSH